MQLIHTGLVSSSEESADRFFVELLGLPKGRRSELTKELAMQLFGVEQSCEIVYYGGDELLFEVFLSGQTEPPERRISHVCIEVPKRDELIERCATLGFGVRQARKGDNVVVVIEDGDGNLFEIKDRQ